METTHSLSKSTSSSTTTTCSDDDELSELRRGPWTADEDSLLMHYISCQGEGRWNLLAERSGLKRTGKSCRLRWLNYLKPDLKRGNLSPEEQLLILDLHSKLGNRWSKIAQYLPGRTDNEIKNYWRTRVQKQARHLKIDANSIEFQKLIRTVWMPRLIQKQQDRRPNSNPYSLSSPPPPASNAVPYGSENQQEVFNATDVMSSEIAGSFSSAYQFGNNLDGHFQNECWNVGNTTGCEAETLSLAADCNCSGSSHHVQDNRLSDEMGWSNFDEFLQWKQPKEMYT